MNTNLRGIANVIRHFVPLMVHRKTGVIVNFSSGWGAPRMPKWRRIARPSGRWKGSPNPSRRELPTGMAAVALNPGIINTEMLRSCFGVRPPVIPPGEMGGNRSAIHSRHQTVGQRATLDRVGLRIVKNHVELSWWNSKPRGGLFDSSG